MAKKKRKNKKKKDWVKKVSLGAKVKKAFFGFCSLFKKGISNLPGKLKRYIAASIMFLCGLIVFLGFFELSGKGGRVFGDFLFSATGNVAYIVPFVFLLWGIVFLVVSRRLLFVGGLAGLSFLIGVAGIFSVFDTIFVSGGKLGSFLGGFFGGLFGSLVSFFIFLTFSIIGALAFSHLFCLYWASQKQKEPVISQVIRKVKALPKFKILEIEPRQEPRPEEMALGELSEKPEPKKAGPFKFVPPPLEFLEQDREKALSGDIKQNRALIENTLENFGIKVTMGEVNVGPTVAQYTLKPAEGVKLSRITGLNNNLSLALAAHPIRIEAPIPGKSLVGIEVPNKVRSKVRLRDLIGSSDFKNTSSNLTFALGRDVSGAVVFSDLARLPHLLVAGATGTGKTIFLNSLVLSLLYQNSPETLRLVLVDPKRVEFNVYSGLPHLLCPVVFDPERTIHALKWLIEEMERRFGILSDAKVKDIASFNEQASKNKEDLLPWIVLIIDELADLMAARGKEIEACIVRIAQMARAVGIHLVVATQRPSVDVITGLIKANITSRISFQVATQFDARTVLDMAGAEKLLGLGDMLYISADRVKPRRIQGAFISEKEVKNVVAWVKENVVAQANGLLASFQEFKEERSAGLEGGLAFDDPLYEEAKKVVIRARKASASLLQRRLRIGYARAASLLDTLEAEGVIGPPLGAKARKVYFEPEDEEELFE